MKNRASKVFVLFLLFACPALSQAQTAPSAGRIGILNIQAAILNTAEGKKALSDLDNKYKSKRADLQSKQQEITALEDQLQRQQSAASDSAQLQLTRQLEEKKKIFTRTQEDAQSDFNADRADMIGRISQKMGRLVQEFAEQNGYALILDSVAPVYSTSGQIGDAQLPVYYAGKDAEITEEIVRRYDAANPVAGGSGTAPANTPATRAPLSSKPTPKPK